MIYLLLEALHSTHQDELERARRRGEQMEAALRADESHAVSIGRRRLPRMHLPRRHAVADARC
jgi:hypothetical protein